MLIVINYESKIKNYFFFNKREKVENKNNDGSQRQIICMHLGFTHLLNKHFTIYVMSLVI